MQRFRVKEDAHRADGRGARGRLRGVNAVRGRAKALDASQHLWRQTGEAKACGAEVAQALNAAFLRPEAHAGQGLGGGVATNAGQWRRADTSAVLGRKENAPRCPTLCERRPCPAGRKACARAHPAAP